jgi:hypothetical protein
MGVPIGAPVRNQRGAKPASANWFSISLTADHITSNSARPSGYFRTRFECRMQSSYVRFEALDNGILSCADPKRLQTICDGLSAAKIDALLRKWLRLLPPPFTAADRKAGYRYDISILQAEFSTTQVLDRSCTAACSLSR